MTELSSLKTTRCSTSSWDPELSASTSSGASTWGGAAAWTLKAVGVYLTVHLSSRGATSASIGGRESTATRSRPVGDIASASSVPAEIASGRTTSRLTVVDTGTRGSGRCWLCRRLNRAAEGVRVHDGALLAKHGSRRNRWRFGLFCAFDCRCNRGLLLALFVEQTLSVSEFTVLTTNNIPQLLKALAADVEAFGGIGLRRIVAEEDESFKCCSRVQLLVDAPKDVVEQRLKPHMHASAAGMLGLGFAT